MILDRVLNEVYISDTSITSKIVKVFEKMSKVKISENKKEAVKLVNELKKAFIEFTNAKRIEIELDDMGSCFTIPPQYNLPPACKLTKKGIIFPSNNDVYIFISINPKWVFKSKVHDEMKLTPRELTAFLLHEIGHNFSYSVMPIHDLLETMKLAIQLRNMETIQLNNEENKISSLERIKQIFKENISKLLYISKLGFFGTLSASPVRELYMDEKIADSFATMYGFGKDLSSGLYKLNKYYTNQANKEYSKLAGTILGALALSISILYDEHPQDVTRMTSQIEQLEYELENNKGLSKKDKQQMRKDIRGIKTVISQYNTINKSDKFSLPWKLYSNFITKFLGGEEMLTKINKIFLNPKILDMVYKNKK